MSANPYQAPASNLSEGPSGEPAPDLWNPDAAGVWSVFLTPIFGSIIISKNWASLGEKSKSRSSKIWAGVSVPIALLFSKVPGILFAYLITWYFLQNRPQTQHLKERFGGKYPKKGWLKPVLIAIAVIFAFSAVTTVVGALPHS